MKDEQPKEINQLQILKISFQQSIKILLKRKNKLFTSLLQKINQFQYYKKACNQLILFKNYQLNKELSFIQNIEQPKVKSF
ncbi:hypothetical protein TTHERM_01692290, partial (macronuclear) [Tetrahymena thermophila SB210]